MGAGGVMPKKTLPPLENPTLAEKPHPAKLKSTTIQVTKFARSDSETPCTRGKIFSYKKYKCTPSIELPEVEQAIAYSSFLAEILQTSTLPTEKQYCVLVS